MTRKERNSGFCTFCSTATYFWVDEHSLGQTEAAPKPQPGQCGGTSRRYFSLSVCNSFPTLPSVLANNQYVTLKSISHLIPYLLLGDETRVGAQGWITSLPHFPLWLLHLHVVPGVCFSEGQARRGLPGRCPSPSCTGCRRKSRGAVALMLSANTLLLHYGHPPAMSQQKESRFSSWGQRWGGAREEEGQKERRSIVSDTSQPGACWGQSQHPFLLTKHLLWTLSGHCVRCRPSS